MAIAYASHSFNTPTGGETQALTKPTGLAVGDLMVAHVHSRTSGDAWSVPANWTQVVGASTDSNAVFYKVADSGDVAASSFNLSRNASEVIGGSIVRITGASTSFQTDSDTYANSGGTSASFSGGVTPAANSLLLFFTAAYSTGGNTMTITDQAITTSNPSWTELYDGGTTTDVDLWMSGAYANRPEATGTGNYTCTLATTSGSTDGILISIQEVVNVTVSPAVVSVIATVQAPSVTGGATVSPAVISTIASVQAPVVSIPTPQFTNVSKNSASAANTAKNSASVTNVSKNSASVVNQSKS